jgi:hypothetical protein
MKKNLFLITVKESGSTEYLYIDGINMAIAINKAYDYLDQNKFPGVGFEILEAKYVGTLAIPEYSITGGLMIKGE